MSLGESSTMKQIDRPPAWRVALTWTWILVGTLWGLSGGIWSTPYLIPILVFYLLVYAEAVLWGLGKRGVVARALQYRSPQD